MALQHPFYFAKQLLVGQVSHAPDKIFDELRGPRREAFLMFLWGEAGRAVDEALPHVGVGRQSAGSELAVHKLAVIGALDVGGQEIVVLSMPPALESNEAFYIALVRGGGAPTVYFYERCAEDGEAVLAGVCEGERANYGFYRGVELEDFKRVLGDHLGVSLEGLETSLPEITMDAFVGAAGSAGSSAGASGEMSWFERLLLARAFLPVGVWATWYVVPFLLVYVSFLLPMVYTLLSLVIGVMLLIWSYDRVGSQRGRTRYGAGMAVGAWLIPLANFILPPLVLRDLWRATKGEEGSFLPLLWWPGWLLQIAYQITIAAGVFVATNHDSGEVALYLGGQALKVWPESYGWIFATGHWAGGMLAPVLAYGGLWYIVREIDRSRSGAA